MGDSDLAQVNADAIAKAEELQRSTTRKAALEHAPAAIEMIAKIGRGNQLPGKQRPTPGTMLKACDSILHQAHGRPETRDGRTGQAEAGLTVIVNQLSTGEQRQVHGVTDIDVVTGGVQAAVQIAERLKREKSDGSQEK